MLLMMHTKPATLQYQGLFSRAELETELEIVHCRTVVFDSVS